MATAFEDLKVAEELSDEIWSIVAAWKPFAKDVVGKQLARAADSVSANIAEAYGRFHYGEKVHFLYYARGSLFETKYWLNRSLARDLIAPEKTELFATELSQIARQINSFV